MGRVVCTLDPEVAAQRDAGMLAQRAAAGSLMPTIPAPRLGNGHFFKSSGNGDYFPQSVSDAGERLDDLLGQGPWLIGHDVPIFPGMLCISLCDPRLMPFREELRAWLGARDAASVLVRPDRYVFGTGIPDELAAAFLSPVHLQPT